MPERDRDAVVARRRGPSDPLRNDPPNPAQPGASSHEAPSADNPPSAEPHCADDWIIRCHDLWSRLTLSSFYQDLEEGSLTPQQYARWLLDRASISMAVLEAATRASDIAKLSTSYPGLPLLRIAKENAQFLAECTVLNGYDINSQYRLSHAGKRLVDFIEASTAPDAPPTVAITAVWGYMFASWQAWSLCVRRGRTLPTQFATIADFLTREDSITQLIQTQDLLDRLLTYSCTAQEVEKASKTFEELVRRCCAVLDHTLYTGEGNHVPLCTCGRKGHYPSQCTFKSHI